MTTQNKEIFTYHKPDSLANIAYWLDNLAGTEWTSGTVVRVIDWQVFPPTRFSDFQAIARVEVKSS